MLGTFPFLGKQSCGHDSRKTAAASDLSAVYLVLCQDEGLIIWGISGCGVRRGKTHPCNLQLNPSLETIKMSFKHFCMEIAFIPPHTLLGMQKTKQNKTKAIRRSKVLAPVSEDSSIRLETFTTKHIYTNNMAEFMCEILCFQSQQECKALYRWSRGICRFKVIPRFHLTGTGNTEQSMRKPTE